MDGGISRTGWQAVRRLLHRRGRQAAGALLVEGARAVSAALAHPKRVTTLLVGPEMSAKSRTVWQQAVDLKVRIQALTEEQTRALAGTAHSQDLFCVLRWAPEIGVPDSIGPFHLHLSGVRDPSNMGALLRSAAAFAIPVTCSKDCADVTHPVAVRSGVAAYFDLDIHVDVALAALAKTTGHTVVRAAPSNGTPLADFRWPERTILVIGGEAEGATEAHRPDREVTIPSRIESLNTAVACGILLWDARLKSGAQKADT
jgi:TrmH family RNA methyltransferase